MLLLSRLCRHKQRQSKASTFFVAHSLQLSKKRIGFRQIILKLKLAFFYQIVIFAKERGEVPFFLCLLFLKTMDLAANLTQILETEIFGEDIFLVELVINDKRKLRVSIFIDADDRLDIDACASVSRRLSHIIEERNIIEDAFVLDVSSPGVDKPLKIWRQYAKHIGRQVQITTVEDKEWVGLLKEVDQNSLLIEVAADKKKKIPAQEVRLEQQQIKLTQVLVAF